MPVKRALNMTFGTAKISHNVPVSLEKMSNAILKPKPRRNKYRNKPTIAHGIKFHSKAEAGRYEELWLLMNSGEIRNLKRQVRYDLHCSTGVKICSYISDFDYDEQQNGSWVPVVEDVKGFETPEYKLKRKWMLSEHGIEIRETRLRKKKKNVR